MCREASLAGRRTRRAQPPSHSPAATARLQPGWHGPREVRPAPVARVPVRAPPVGMAQLPGVMLRGWHTALMTGLSLALANLKPGTGKTTSAVWLAHVFAEAGHTVLLVDADPSGSALEWSDLAAMDPRLAPPAAFPFRSWPCRPATCTGAARDRPGRRRGDHRHAAVGRPRAIALSALRYADEIVIRARRARLRSTAPRRCGEITEAAAARDRPPAGRCC